MSIHVTLGDDNDFDEAIEAHLRHRIDLQISGFLSHQLKGVIEGHVARLRLTDPNSRSVAEAMDDAIGEFVDRKLQERLPALIDSHLRVKLRHLFDQV